MFCLRFYFIIFVMYNFMQKSSKKQNNEKWKSKKFEEKNTDEDDKYRALVIIHHNKIKCIEILHIDNNIDLYFIGASVFRAHIEFFQVYQSGAFVVKITILPNIRKRVSLRLKDSFWKAKRQKKKTFRKRSRVNTLNHIFKSYQGFAQLTFLLLLILVSSFTTLIYQLQLYIHSGISALNETMCTEWEIQVYRTKTETEIQLKTKYYLASERIDWQMCGEK